MINVYNDCYKKAMGTLEFPAPESGLDCLICA